MFESTPLTCPRCQSTNVSVSFVQSGGRSSHRGAGLIGHSNNTMRAMTALMTLGMSNLVWRKSKGGSRQKFKNQKRALCQSCGYDWRLHGWTL